jgi:benzoylformate decarboxylase
MSRTGADVFAEALESYGVTHVFGNPGTTELPILNAVSESDLNYVLALHEDVAVGMAAGYATTRRYHGHDEQSVMPLGVANLHIAPGVAHGLCNLLNASHTGAPLLVTAGDHTFAHGQREPNLAGDMVTMTEQFTKWSARVQDIEALPWMLRRAVRTALTPPTGPVFLALPMDVASVETGVDVEPLGDVPTAGRGDEERIERAAAELAAADRPVFVVGDEVARGDAVDEAVALAEAVGARVFGEFKLSEVAFPTGHDQWAGRLPRDQEYVARSLDTDTVAFLGVKSNVPTNPLSVDLLSPGTTSVQVSPNPWELGKNFTADVAVLGDLRQVLSSMADLGASAVDEATRSDRLADATRTPDTGGLDVERSNPEDAPERTVTDLATALNRAAPDVRVVGEAPTSLSAVTDAYDFEPGDYFAARGGGLGYGLPAAVGSAVAETHRVDPRDVVAFIGDGSYLYYPHALYSAARENLNFTVVIPDNRNYRVLKDNTQRLFGGTDDDYDYVGMDFHPPVDFAANAESHGAAGRLVDDGEDVEAAVRDAVAADGPVVLDVPIRD